MKIIDSNKLDRALNNMFGKIKNTFATKNELTSGLNTKANTSHGAHLSLGTSASTAYRGDRGETAYNHSQAAHAPSNAQKNSDITKAEIEAKLTGTITSHAHNYKDAEPTKFSLQTNYVSVRTAERTASQHYEFWDSNAGWADIKAGKVYDNNNRVYSASNKPTPADIGAAASSHGTHVSYGGNGSATTVSRSDHSHTLFTRSEVGDIGWSTDSNKGLPVAVSAIAYWNGAYNGTTSNLLYCKQGTFGTIVTKNSGDYLGANANAVSASKWATARTVTIGGTGKSVDGTRNVSWSLAEIMKGQGLNAANACGTLYFVNGAKDHVGRISCYQTDAGNDYTQLGFLTNDGTNVNYINIYASEVNTKYGMNFGDETSVRRSSGNCYFAAKRTDSGVECKMGVGSGGTNHGLYSTGMNKWIIYADSSNKTHVSDFYVDGKRLAITSSAPSSPATGDVWIDI